MIFEPLRHQDTKVYLVIAKSFLKASPLSKLQNFCQNREIRT